MTVGFGHGLAVTPLHLIAGYAALVNGGVSVTPTLLRRGPAVRDAAPALRRRVVSAETSAIMRMLLYGVVAEGTGRKAAVPGYLVGGKTGTAEKAIGGRYRHDSMITSFVAVFPIDRPRYAVLTLMDEPKGPRRPWASRRRLDCCAGGRRGDRAHRARSRHTRRARRRRERRGGPVRPERRRRGTACCSLN